MKKKVVFLFGALLIIFLLFSSYFLTFIGNFLIIRDPLRKADVIIVLAGERGERVKFGVSLYQQGYAGKVLFSGGPIAAFPGGQKITWADMMKNYAMTLGVPEKDIILQNESRSTQEDATFTYRLLQDPLRSSAILVTSPYHSKRALKIFKPVFIDIKLHSVPVQKSWYDAESWWKSSKGQYQVAREYFAFFWFYLERTKNRMGGT